MKPISKRRSKLAPCKFFDLNEYHEAQGSTSEGEQQDLSLEYKLKVILTEYEVLKKEIQKRSEFENRFVQLHIIALTSIIGAVISQSLGLWLLFLIPIESSIIGLWYLEHSININKIGAYIQTSIEPRVNNLVNEKIMEWETITGNINVSDKIKKIYNFRMLLFLTFGGPSTFILLTTPIFIYINIYNINDIFQIDPIYASISWISVLILWMFGFILTLFYYLSARQRTRQWDARKSREFRISLHNYPPAGRKDR